MAPRPATSVLVVDDQAAFRVAARRLFSHSSAFVLVGEAETTAAAVASAKALLPDLVLMDISLAEESGIEATRKILLEAPGTKVVLVSTYQDSDLPQGASECGAIAYLHKEDLAIDTLAALISGGASAAKRFGG